MKIGTLPDQVIRLIIIFALLFAGLIVARYLFVPNSFGKFGHYRAEALAEIMAQPIKYGGSVVCSECHSDVDEQKNNSYHRGLKCEVCHGASNDHASAPDEKKPTIPKKRDHCANCHSYLPSRPTGFPQINFYYHNPNKPCIECHNPHDPKPPVTPSTCAACHANIARTLGLSYHAALGCETCHEAVPEHKDIPRMFIPKKPTERSFCGKCHDPKSQSAKEIPKIEPSSHYTAYLCWQCHYPHFPEAR